MTRSVSILWGLVLVAIGGGLLAWIAYNVFVETLPDAKGRPIAGTIFGVGAIWTGVGRIRRGLRAPDAGAPGAE